MKVILRADVEKLGRLGQIVKVKPGFGRNYLIPKGLAMPATDANQRVFESERKKLQAAMDSVKAAAERLAEQINAAHLTVPVRVGENDRLYGSVTNAQLADMLGERGLDIDRKKITMDEPLRSLGVYEIEVRLHPDVRAVFKVSVVRHESEAEQESKQEAGSV